MLDSRECGILAFVMSFFKMASYTSTQAGLRQVSVIYSIVLLFLFLSSVVIAHPYTTHNSHPHGSAVAEDLHVCRRESM